MISLPEKSNGFQGLMLDLHFIHTKCLLNSLHIIVPAALPVLLALVSSNFLVLLLWRFLLCVTMPDTSSSLLVHGSSRIKDWFFLDLVKPWEVLHINSGLIPLANVLCFVLRSS